MIKIYKQSEDSYVMTFDRTVRTLCRDQIVELQARVEELLEPEKSHSYLNDLLDEIFREEHDDKTIIRTLRHIGARITRIEEKLGL